MSAVDNVYDLRQKFMILGLTGRTGSGCTTVANLLKEGFTKFSPIPSMSNAGVSNDDRKYRIEYNYLKSQWGRNDYQFTIIKASDIIFFYALKKNFEDFCRFFNAESGDDEKEKRLLAIKDKYTSMSESVKGYEEYLENKVYEKRLYDTKNGHSDASEKEEVIAKMKGCLKFISVDLPAFRNEVMNTSGKTPGEITDLFQKWGDSIRKYGETDIEIDGKYKKIPENDDKKSEGDKAPSYLAQTINRIIKLIRGINILENKPTFIIIDSLRNPYEVLYFRERYSSFYLLSINTSETERRNNLIKADYTNREISDLDEKEFPSKKRKEISISLYSQDVERCVELSDIHIIHNNQNVINNIELKKQLLHIVALILHPGLVQPTHEERLMQIAYTAKFNSGCISRQVGAVVTDKNFSVKAIGWNTVPKGQTPCCLRDLRDLREMNDLSAFSPYEKANEEFREKFEEICQKYYVVQQANNSSEIPVNKLGGLPLPFCFKDSCTPIKKMKDPTLTRSLHAEENAFLQLAKYGSEGIDGGYLFTTASCCELCAKKAYQLGISKIYYIDIYPGISQEQILSAGEHKVEVIQFKGIIGRAYESLYSPFFPLKDEIENLTGVKGNIIQTKQNENNNEQ